MKHGKNPTAEQRRIIDYYHLNSENWFVCKATSDELIIKHRFTGTVRKIARVSVKPPERRKRYA